MSPRLSRGTVVRIERPITPAPKPAAPPPKKRQFSSIAKPTLDEVRAAQRKPKPAKKSRPKKPAWLLPEKVKSQARIERDEMERVYGSVARVKWIRQQPCIVAANDLGHAGETDGHHIKTGGKSRKADARFIAPLCRFHHTALHLIGRKSFEDLYHVCLEREADRTHSRWEDHAETLGITKP